MTRPFAPLLIPALALALIAAGEPPRPGAVGSVVEDFTRRDPAGVERSLAKLAEGKKAVVLAFVGIECPLAKLYAPRLAELARKYEAQGVAFVGIDPNHQDDLTEIAAYARAHDLPFPVLADGDAALADRLGVTRTPEVLLLDEGRAVRYRGRIDDQYAVGARKRAATATALIDAIEAVLKGEPVAVAETEPVGCLVGRKPDPQPGAEVTYSKQIARLLNARCVECHREGQIGPFALTSYEDAAAWAGTMRETIRDGRMPPWFADPAHGAFRNDARLSDDEKRLFDAWVDAGCPEGDTADLPSPPTFAEGWRIEQPDLVFDMADTPFEVPAEGTVDYQYFRVDPKFTEDKYLVAAEPRPGDYGVVHHIIVYVMRPGQKKINAAEAAIGYAPGLPPVRLPAGHAIRIPAGSQLVFEMHYTPNGKPARDLSKVGMRFCGKSEVTTLVRSHAAANNKFEIPPGAKAHTVMAADTIEQDRCLTSLTPHMHFRGAAFKYEARYPDGTREVLLDVPRYDFNWQLRYDLAEPKPLPKGTKIVCTAVFDNSPDNPANPDPTATVRWGEQSWEEMMIGFYATVPAEPRPPVEARKP
jgi:peroxiredoxin